VAVGTAHDPDERLGQRVGRIALAVVSGLVLLAAAVVDLPGRSDGRFWSDGATYTAMAGSLARDGDVEFRREDLERVRRVWREGPQGVFLKRVAGPGGRERLVYAKALAYPAVAAPLVRLVGSTRGLLLVNAVVFVVALWLSFGELKRRGGGGAAAVGAATVLFGGVAPVYLLWPTPEIFNLGLVTLGLVAWSRGRPSWAAVALGVAVYSKPTNAALALPLLLDPLVREGGWRRARVLAESARRAALVGVVALAGFGATWLATGEANYQGGERKTFYDRYPLDPGVTFDSAGVWMTTDHVGPLVAGRDVDVDGGRVAPPRAPRELRRSFWLNLGYFWVGRFGGALPYFPGAGLALVAFLLSGPRERRGWLAVLALVVSWLGYIVLIPDNWYGGGGTIGNRYFVNLLPLAVFFLPAARAWWVAAASAGATVVLLGPVLASPIEHSLRPGEHATRAAFRILPAELTMLGDLSVFGDVWRKRRPYNAPGGDPSRRPPGAPPSYFLWFLDDGTFPRAAPTDPTGRDGRAGRRHRHGACGRRAPATRAAAPADAGARVRLSAPVPGLLRHEPLPPPPRVEAGRLDWSGPATARVLRACGAGRARRAPDPAGHAPRREPGRSAGFALGALLLPQERVEAAADLRAALRGARLEETLAGRRGDREMLAGEIDPGHGLARVTLLLEEGAQVRVRVQVAREGLYGRAPLVARVALRDGCGLRHEKVGADDGPHLRARQAVELDAVLQGGHLLDIPDGRQGSDGREVARRDGRLPVGDGEDGSARPQGHLEGGDRGGVGDHDRQRGARKQAQVGERQHRNELCSGRAGGIRVQETPPRRCVRSYRTEEPNRLAHLWRRISARVARPRPGSRSR
jgi:hypothetical protein